MSLKTRILIGADGTHSTLRQLAGLATDTMDYQQTALVTVTELQRSHAHTAYERFHGNGAIAMLPLLGNRVATIWTEDNAVIQRLLALSNVDFCQTLQNEFGYRLGRLVSCGARYSYPLQRQTTLQNFARSVVLIGNAAHTLHPVAAQGLNLALAEVAMLTETLAESIQTPDWESYRQWQQQQMNRSLRLSHDLLQLFSHDLTPLAWARQTGLVALDICPPLKRRFAARAQGRDRPLPPLLRTKALE